MAPKYGPLKEDEAQCTFSCSRSLATICSTTLEQENGPAEATLHVTLSQ